MDRVQDVPVTEAVPRFGEGDLVRLKTGGPVMVVCFAVEPILLCKWMDAVGRDRRGTFSPRQLQLVEHAYPVWMRAVERLSRRYSIVTLC